MKEKSETSSIFKSFHVISKHNSQPIHRPSTLIWLEISLTLSWVITWYLKAFIKSYCVDTPQQNGVVKHKNRHVLEVARSLLFSRNVHHQYWGDAILTATYLINRMPFRVLKFKTPIQILLESYPIFRVLNDIPMCIFGYTAFVHIHSHSGAGWILVLWDIYFFGTPVIKKRYKCYSPITRKFYSSMNVIFHEDESFCTPSSVQG